MRGGLDPGRVHLRRVGIQAEAELRAQGATHGSVDRLAAHLAGRHGIGERLAEVAGGRHLDVEPRLHRGHRAARSEDPIGLDETLEAPVAVEHLAQQVGVLAAVRAVHLVVCRHDGARVPLLHGTAEVWEKDLA